MSVLLARDEGIDIAITDGEKRSGESYTDCLTTLHPGPPTPTTERPPSNAEDSTWQIIIVQAKTGTSSHSKAVPLQTIVTYGDQKESTPIVKAKTPLWNFWTQMSDEGGTEMMVFSLLERDSSAGKITVKGEARLDLSKFRQIGYKSFELWEPLRSSADDHPAARVPAPDLLHLTVTYCPKIFDEVVEDADCQLCTALEIAQCSIS